MIKRALILLLFFVISCKSDKEIANPNIEIAFLADIHFQDIYAHFEDADYQGIKNPETGNYTNIRTMNAQLRSTRVFNENYFAFLSALDDIVARGIKYVALPGDFSDDGQPVHVKGLRKILDSYAQKHGIMFFATTGNHDPVKPFTQEASTSDFLGEGGKEQLITSTEANLNEIVSGHLKPVITSEIEKWGYKGILNEMSTFGFYPQNEYLYWETPFSTYTYDNYSLENAKKASDLGQRVYAIDENNLHPDASYLVEPTDGLWILAIDANVYMPHNKLSSASHNPSDFYGASIGYNNVLLQKSHLVSWVEKVAEEAKRRSKVLIAFSHYPIVDFNDDASKEMKQFFGDDKMQLHRVPREEVAETFANAGIQIHFGGHMHINDTGIRTSAKGNTLYNVQTPSLAAYVPAYKILKIQSATVFKVETIVLESVENYNSLFPLYELEYAYLEEMGEVSIWDKDILRTKNYKEFTQWHLKELVRFRYLPKDWPAEFITDFLTKTGAELLLTNNELTNELKQQLTSKNLTIGDFKNWSGIDMVHDFYKLRNGDELVFSDIGLKRLNQYEMVCHQFKKSKEYSLVLWANIFTKVCRGQPSDHFIINLDTNTIKQISS